MSVIIPYTPGNVPTYRFYISNASSTSVEVFPINFLESSLQVELESDQAFYRIKFNGSLLFGTNSLVIDEHGVTQNRKDDYTLFAGLEEDQPCRRFYLTITKNSVTIPYIAAEVYWEGYFATSNGKWDHDQCTFEVTPLANDDYADLLDKADDPISLLALTDVTVNAKIGTVNNLYTRNKWLYDPAETTDGAIQFVLDQITTGLTVHSEFFTDAVNQVTLATNHVNYLTIAQKSDIIRPASTDRAGVFEISWNELMNILWVMFQVKWNIIGTVVTVEHISWFTGANGADLRTQLSAVATNKYVYLKESMPKYETFKFMEAYNTDFVGQPIWYDSDCVDQNKDTNILEKPINVTTDLEYIMNTPDEISDDGFVILANYLDGGTYYVRISDGAYAHDILLNMDLSWANLHNCFYRHNRVLIEGYMNAAPKFFWTAQKTIQQECNIIQCTAFDPTLTLQTELGEIYLHNERGTVKTAKISPTDDIALSLIYGPPHNDNTGVPDNKWVRLTENGCGTFTALFSEVPTENYTISIKHIILDAVHAIVCTDGVGQDWVIDHDDWDAPFSLVLCDTIPSGGCIWYPSITHAGLTSAGWTVSEVFDPDCKCYAL